MVDGVATEHRDDDDTEADEDLYNRGVVSRVTLTTSPSLDLEDVIAEKEIQWQDIPYNKTYETSPTINTIAEDMGMSETCQRMDAHEMHGNTAASQHRMRKQVPIQSPQKGTRNVHRTSNFD